MAPRQTMVGSMEHNQGDDVLPGWTKCWVHLADISLNEVAWAGFRAQGHSVLRLGPQLSVGCQVHQAFQ